MTPATLLTTSALGGTAPTSWCPSRAKLSQLLAVGQAAGSQEPGVAGTMGTGQPYLGAPVQPRCAPASGQTHAAGLPGTMQAQGYKGGKEGLTRSHAPKN